MYGRGVTHLEVTESLRAHSQTAEALGLLGFLGFLLLPVCLASVEWLDASIASRLDVLPGGQLHAISAWITRQAPVLAAALVVIGVVVSVRRGATIADVCRVVVLLAVGLLLVEGVKLFISRERPGGPWEHPSASASFPSGHVANVALCVVATLALVVQLQNQRDGVRALLTAAGSLLVTAVAFTRVYLGLHWFSDVVGSLLLGVSFAGMLFARPTVRQWLLHALLLVLAILYFMVACGIHVAVPSPRISVDDTFVGLSRDGEYGRPASRTPTTDRTTRLISR